MTKTFNFLILFSMVALLCGCPLVNPSYEGVLMTNCGKNGISDFKIVSGRVNDWGVCDDLFIVPMFQQEGDMEPVELTLAGGAKGFFVKPEYRYKAMRNKGPEIVYENNRFGSGDDFLDNVEDQVLEGRIREQVIDIARGYDPDSLLNNMIQYEEAVTKAIEDQFASVFFELQGFTLNLTPPKSLVNAIAAKADEVEKTKKVQEELNRERAQIELDLERAKAEVEIAKLTKEANKILDQGLTDKVLKHKWIEAWKEAGCPVPQVVGDGSGQMYNINLKK